VGNGIGFSGLATAISFSSVCLFIPRLLRFLSRFATKGFLVSDSSGFLSTLMTFLALTTAITFSAVLFFISLWCFVFGTFSSTFSIYLVTFESTNACFLAFLLSRFFKSGANNRGLSLN
jgi:hypothetical protein